MNIFLILALAAGAVALVYALLLALKIGRADGAHGATAGVSPARTCRSSDTCASLRVWGT